MDARKATGGIESAKIFWKTVECHPAIKLKSSGRGFLVLIQALIF